MVTCLPPRPRHATPPVCRCPQLTFSLLSVLFFSSLSVFSIHTIRYSSFFPSYSISHLLCSQSVPCSPFLLPCHLHLPSSSASLLTLSNAIPLLFAFIFPSFLVLSSFPYITFLISLPTFSASCLTSSIVSLPFFYFPFVFHPYSDLNINTYSACLPFSLSSSSTSLPPVFPSTLAPSPNVPPSTASPPSPSSLSSDFR